jgi:DNA phosphorothioation-dependent restriction protein DptH
VANIRNQEIKAIFNSQTKYEEEAHMSNILMLEKHHSLYVDGKKKIRKIRDSTFWETV